MQGSLLEEDALKAQTEKIKSSPLFKEMARTAGREKMANALIKGMGSFAVLYKQAVTSAQAKGHQPTAAELGAADKTKAQGIGLDSHVK